MYHIITTVAKQRAVCNDIGTRIIKQYVNNGICYVPVYSLLGLWNQPYNDRARNINSAKSTSHAYHWSLQRRKQVQNTSHFLKCYLLSILTYCILAFCLLSLL